MNRPALTPRRALTRRPISSERSAFTLLELITAMAASTVLVASLAATVVISTRLLEVPPNDAEAWRDRMIADRLASDLRYATRFDESYGDGFELTKPDSAGGSQQTVTYESYSDGMTRQVAGGPVMNLDPEAPGQQFFVDGYSAPTYIPAETYARVRSSSTATTSSAAASVDIDLPPGCKTDDLVILCVSAKAPTSLTVSETGWQTLSDLSAGDLRLVSLHRSYDTSWPSTLRVTASPATAMAVAMVVIEDVSASAPIDWSGSNGGLAVSFLSDTHPTPLETSGFSERQLNIQIFAADLDPWIVGALGMAGFTDVAQATAAENDFSIRNTIGIAVRNGAAPELATAPRLLHQESGFWLQTAIRVETAP